MKDPLTNYPQEHKILYYQLPNQFIGHKTIVKRKDCDAINGRICRIKETLLGQHLWGIGYVAWSSGNITDEMIENYLEHHRDNPNSEQNFILE